VNFRRGRREEPEINLTPLIDVVFLMLIFFMVSTTFLNEADLDISLPETSREPTQRTGDPVELVINQQGDYHLNGSSLANQQRSTLRRAMEQVMAERGGGSLVIRGDARTPHQSLVTALDAAGQAGIEKVSIATVPEDN